MNNFIIIIGLSSILFGGMLCTEYGGEYCTKPEEPLPDFVKFYQNNDIHKPFKQELTKSIDTIQDSNSLIKKYKKLMKKEEIVEVKTKKQIQQTNFIKKEDKLFKYLKNIQEIKKDTFESTDEFTQRKKDAINRLENKLKTLPKKDLNLYSAGIATMIHYDADLEKISLSLQWNKKLEILFPEIKNYKSLILNIPKNDAKILFSNIIKQPFYLIPIYEKGIKVFLKNNNKYFVQNYYRISDKNSNIFFRAILKKMPKKRFSYNYSFIENILGLNMYIGKHNKHILNPELLKSINRLIVTQKNSVIEKKIQKYYYHNKGKKIIKSLVVARKFLYEQTKIENEIMIYKNKIKSNSNFLRERYASDIKNYLNEIEQKSNIKYNNSIQKDVGFWLRRKIDGTDKLCLEILENFLKVYDLDLLSTLKN